MIGLGACGVAPVLMIGVSVVSIGCGMALAVPRETAARDWLAASLAALLAGALCLASAIVALVVSAAELAESGVLPTGWSNAGSVLLLAGAALLFLSAGCHGGFLRRLALHLEDLATARSAAAYQVFLFVGTPAIVVSLSVASLFLETTSKASFMMRLAALVLTALLLGWWLSLLHRTRWAVSHGLPRRRR
jgi:hypothetical protein